MDKFAVNAGDDGKIICRAVFPDEFEREIRSVGPVIHGIECYEAWREFKSCPHE